MALPRSAPILDRLGGVITVLIGLAVFASPFVTYRANRIVAGEPRMLLHALPLGLALGVIATALAVAAVAVLVRGR
jgi:osmoprotectant transport system permease protein